MISPRNGRIRSAISPSCHLRATPISASGHITARRISSNSSRCSRSISTRIGTSSAARSSPSSGIRICCHYRACRRRSRRRINRRSCRPETQSMAGPWARARPFRSRPPPARPSAPASGASARPLLSSIPPSTSSPACWPTRSGPPPGVESGPGGKRKEALISRPLEMAGSGKRLRSCT